MTPVKQYAKRVERANELARAGNADAAIALLDPEDAARRAQFQATKTSPTGDKNLGGVRLPDVEAGVKENLL